MTDQKKIPRVGDTWLWPDGWTAKITSTDKKYIAFEDEFGNSRFGHACLVKKACEFVSCGHCIAGRAASYSTTCPYCGKEGVL